MPAPPLSLPPPLPQQQHQEQQTKKGAQVCLQVLQGAAALVPMHAQGLCELVREEKAQGRDEDATATHTLRTLRDAFDDVLGDGESRESAKRKRVEPAQENNLTENQDVIVPNPSTIDISTAPSTACAKVLQSKPGHLLTSIIGWLFHERHTLPSRVALGQTALVSKEWCHISRQTCFWRPLVRALLPAVGSNDESMIQGRGRKGYFDCVSNYGKCLAESHVVTGDSDLFDGLELQIEMWNGGALPLRIFSAVGPIRTTSVDGTTPGSPPTVILRITGPHRKEVPGPAFSAADLDPVQRRYPNLKECFDGAQDLANPLHLCMRVTVTDRHSGKMALVWSSLGKEKEYLLADCADWVYEYLPGVSYFLRSAGWTRLYRRNRNHSFSAYVGCQLHLLPGQENIDEIDKKHMMGIVPSHHASFGEMVFKTGESKTVATFLRSLLE
jgi:hypothetical protein